MTLSIEVQGTVLVARDNRRLTTLKRQAATKRSTIRVFSGASRRRLIELMARLNVSATRTSFLTLTFSGTPTADEATRAFRAFCMRLRRKFPKASAIWRKELQKRGAWHYHLILFDVPYWSQKQIQYAWECCTRESMSRVHIKLLRGGKQQAMFYVSKYLAKRDGAVVSPSLDNAAYPHDEGNEEQSIGRLWGWVNREGLPFDVRRTIILKGHDLLEPIWAEMARLSNGLAASQARAARLYGTCCYDLAEKIVHNAADVIYDEITLNSTKYHKPLLDNNFISTL